MDYSRLIRSADFRPERLVPPDSWIGHIPFAAWLIQILQPRTFVELGTHSGNSYFAFCQATKQETLSTKCFAVDTWQGDEHAGYYGEDIFKDVNQYNDVRYSAFSRLLRMTFDEASGTFPDGSIDLLHIDGLHTYDAVRHDFEAWLPKLSPSAVVLFHDTNVRGLGFGVWQLWDELSRRYPLHLEFVHSHGLGVLQLAEGQDRMHLDWLTPGAPHKLLVTSFFSARGAHVAQQYATVCVIDERDRAIAERDRAIADLSVPLAAAASQLEKARAEQVAREELLVQVRQDVDAVTNLLAQRDQQISALYHSRSWRVTRPMRGVGHALRATRAHLGSALRAVWHQLPLPAETRYRAKSVAFRIAAPALRRTSAYSAWIEQARAGGPTTATGAGLGVTAAGGPVVEDRRIPGGIDPNPSVSIIIPVFNKLQYTLACLDSIARQIPNVPIEVLVIDDGSTDGTETELARRSDISYLRNPKNLGFVGSCNRGAEAARGEFLFFLNNDTIVLEGWLDHLVQTFRDVQDAGLVGSKLVYPDGRLQEAGGIVWADGSGWNWGRLEDPNAPEYNFVRDVDYCSGAAILVRRAIFTALGGFDERYAPAYYEDTDLAFAIRSQGLRVLYQPASQVIHYEGVTAGTDLASGAKAYQVRNRDRFREKWQQVLVGHGDPQSHPPRIAAHRGARARMLIIDECTPTPDQDSGSLDMLNYLRLLVGFGYRVTFIPAGDLLHFGHYTTNLQQLGVECLYRPFITSVEQVLQGRGRDFGAVMLVRVTVAYPLFQKVKTYCPGIPIIFNTVDLHFLREQRFAELETGSPFSPRAEEVRRQELAVITAVDTTIVITPGEQHLLADAAPGARVRVIPILREIPGRSADYRVREGVLFVGGFRHPPNVDAMVWFCAEVWPLIRLELPDVQFSIIGSHMVPEVRALEGNGVQVLGFVADVEPLFARARLSVAPLRYGAGQNGKVVTSLSFGVPCVMTTLVAKGLEIEDRTLVADKPADFAATVIRLYQDPDLWKQTSDDGLTRVERDFSLNSNRGKLAGLLAELHLPLPSDSPAEPSP